MCEKSLDTFCTRSEKEESNVGRTVRWNLIEKMESKCFQKVYRKAPWGVWCENRLDYNLVVKKVFSTENIFKLIRNGRKFKQKRQTKSKLISLICTQIFVYKSWEFNFESPIKISITNDPVVEKTELLKNIFCLLHPTPNFERRRDEGGGNVEKSWTNNKRMVIWDIWNGDSAGGCCYWWQRNVSHCFNLLSSTTNEFDWECWNGRLSFVPPFYCDRVLCAEWFSFPVKKFSACVCALTDKRRQPASRLCLRMKDRTEERNKVEEEVRIETRENTWIWIEFKIKTTRIVSNKRTPQSDDCKATSSHCLSLFLLFSFVIRQVITPIEKMTNVKWNKSQNSFLAVCYSQKYGKDPRHAGPENVSLSTNVGFEIKWRQKTIKRVSGIKWHWEGKNRFDWINLQVCKLKNQIKYD